MAYMYQKRRADLFLELQDKLSLSGIKDASTDSMANILTDFIITELTSISGEFNNQLGQLDIESAEGEALDRLAFDMYGLRRFEASEAIASDNVQFFNSSTTSNITIPEGTRLSNGQVYNEDDIVYETIEEVTIEARSSGFVTVKSIFTGSEQNIASTGLTNHNLNVQNLTCLNIYPIINGSDRETDGNFRVRINNYLSATINRNLEYLRFNLLEVPGVYNLKFFQGYRGLGTMSVFATTSGLKTDDAIRRILQNRIDEIKLPGEKIYYEPGEKLLCNITMKLINDRAFSRAEIDQIKFDIRRLISEELVKSKTSGSINFSAIEASIKRNLISYNFSYNNNNSIYESIILLHDNNSNTGANKILDINTNIVYSLDISEIPEVGTLDIEVELNL